MGNGKKFNKHSLSYLCMLWTKTDCIDRSTDTQEDIPIYPPPPLKNMFAGAIHMFFVLPKDQDLENEKSGKKVITV